MTKITIDRAVVEQALEALEKMARLTGARWALENSYAGHLEAIVALRAALAQHENSKEALWNDLKEWCKQHNISPAHYDDLYSLLMYVNITQTNLKENT